MSFLEMKVEQRDRRRLVVLVLGVQDSTLHVKLSLK